MSVMISKEGYAALVERFGDIIHEVEGLAQAIYEMENAKMEKLARPQPREAIARTPQ